MALIISIALRKGGSGKTTTAVNLAAGLAVDNNKVLLIDLDPQSNATMDLGFMPEDFNRSIVSLFENPMVKIQECIYPIKFGDNYIFDFMPSNPSLSKIEMAMKSTQIRIISKILEPILAQYKYIIIDTPPSESYLTINALTASDYVLIPMQTDKRAFDSVDKLLEEIEQVRDNLNDKIKVIGILPTMYYKKAKICQYILQQAKLKYEDLVLPFEIEYSAKYKEASFYGKNIFEYDSSYKQNTISSYISLIKHIKEIKNG